MPTTIEPTISVASRPHDDADLASALGTTTARPRFTCAHCHEVGTTATSALWRVSPAPDRRGLYYLHSACIAPYKAAHRLRSVEGRIPRRIA